MKIFHPFNISYHDGCVLILDKSPFGILMSKCATFVTFESLPADENECVICFESLSNPSGFNNNKDDQLVTEFKTCQHIFHHACLKAMYQSSGGKVSKIK